MPGQISVGAPVKLKVSGEDWIMRGVLVAIGLYLIVAIVLPLYALLSKSFQNKDGTFIGLANFTEFFSTPALSYSVNNSLTIASISTVIVVSLAFVYAYALTRSCMPFKSLFKGVALIPILMPSLLPAISLIFMFGKQGFLRFLLFGHDIYGPIGIVMGEVIYVFPHVLMIILIAMSMSDGRLYEASESLGASKVRTFFTVTLPGIRYGLVSAGFVAFTLIITDFGVPKVVGGQYNVLATDVYKQVVGRQDFEMGAVVSMVLLIPAVIAFAADRIVQRKQIAILTARAVPYAPQPSSGFDAIMTGFCALIAVIIVGILGVALFASLVKFWPYNLSLTLGNYDFSLRDGGGWDAYANSIEMAAWTAVIGTCVVFIGAYLVEKSKGFHTGRAAMQFLAMMPMAVPGLSLGLAYIFFFNAPDNPLNFLYHTMPILVICTITHFYTVSHLTAVTALKQIDAEFESVSASLKVPFYKTFWRVTVPVCVPAILDISMYFFVNAMTTVSAVVFLYSPDTALASVAVLNMDDAGEQASAAAMGIMIVLTAGGARLLHALLTRGLARRTQAWRKR
ncbi:MAG: putative 2-aminoethylphosphonate ABC transporter permease subunit [Rhodospirillales bacterium]|nr:putative 2-aminoethylphosphonate ABC transporter permease subunit [Alphaproteobacteria bacterium]MBL6947549.1 putative 2-aminoethylphosphonate ABC transporter permease subunit [Rhodospirillales bacterium]